LLSAGLLQLLLGLQPRPLIRLVERSLAPSVSAIIQEK
jgi:hypothetical protein